VYLSMAAPPVVMSMLFSVPYGDKIGHSVAYAMLTFLCAGAFRFNTGQWAAVTPLCWRWEPHSASG